MNANTSYFLVRTQEVDNALRAIIRKFDRKDEQVKLSKEFEWSVEMSETPLSNKAIDSLIKQLEIIKRVNSRKADGITLTKEILSFVREYFFDHYAHDEAHGFLVYTNVKHTIQEYINLAVSYLNGEELHEKFIAESYTMAKKLVLATMNYNQREAIESKYRD